MARLEEELFDAVNTSNVEGAKACLAKGASVNAIVYSGQTILGRAVQLGNVELIESLLQYEGPPAPPPPATAPDSPLEILSQMQFASWNNGDEPPGLGLFRSLSRYIPRPHCDVNLADFYDRMPVHYAAELGCPEVLALLLKSGGRVNTSDSDNITPLHLAVGRGHLEVTRMLLKAGSRVNSKTSRRSSQGRTSIARKVHGCFSDKASALHLAASRGYRDIAALLLDHGAKIDLPDGSERTPLLLAASRGHIGLVLLLVQRGAAVNVEEIHGYTPLAEAVWQKRPELVEVLLTAGSKVPASHHLLHFCVAHHSLHTLRLLLKTGAAVNLRDDAGDTPLHLAVRTGQLDHLQLLLNYGANVNCINGISGQTLIHEAVESLPEDGVFVTVLQVLLRWGCSLERESFTNGDSALWRALVLGKKWAVVELLREGFRPRRRAAETLLLASRLGLARLLLLAGLPYPSALPYGPTRKALLPQPLALTSLCRIRLRHLLSPHISRKLPALRLPSVLRDFLLFRSWESDPAVDTPPHAHMG